MTQQEIVELCRKTFGEHHIVAFIKENGQPMLVMNGSPEVQCLLFKSLDATINERILGRLHTVKREMPPLPPIPAPPKEGH